MNRRAAEKGTLTVTATRDLPGLAISGEIDEITYGELVAVLERFAEGQDESMSASRGWSTAISPGCGPSSPWPRLVLHDVPPHLNEILRILGWGATPGLTLDERSSPPAIPPARLHRRYLGPERAMTYADAGGHVPAPVADAPSFLQAVAGTARPTALALLLRRCSHGIPASLVTEGSPGQVRVFLHANTALRT